MTEQELLDELYAAEEAVRSPAHQTQLRELHAAEIRASSLAQQTGERIQRRDDAIAAWKDHLLDKTGDVNVHEAVAAIADAPPETADNSGEDEDFGWQVAEAPKAEVPVTASIGEYGAAPESVLAQNFSPVEEVRPIIGRASDVTDEQLAEAQAQDRREAERYEVFGY